MRQVGPPSLWNVGPGIYRIAPLIDHAGEVGAAVHSPIAGSPGTQQLGIIRASRLQLVAVLRGIYEAVAVEGRGCVNPLAFALGLQKGFPGCRGEHIALGQPVMPGAAGVGRYDHPDRHVFRAAQVGAHQVQQFGRRVLACLIHNQQGEGTALVLRVVGVAFELAQLQVSAIGEAPDVLSAVVAGGCAVHGAEQLPADQLEVGQALVGAAQVQDAGLLPVLLGMAQAD
ncbi:hypothetical protein D3C85_1039160 [compost metagenome]